MSWVTLQHFVDRGLPLDLKGERGRHEHLLTDECLDLIKKHGETVATMLESQLGDKEWLIGNDGVITRTEFGAFIKNEDTGKMDVIEIIRVDLKPWINRLPPEEGVKAVVALEMIAPRLYRYFVGAFPCMKLAVNKEEQKDDNHE